MLDHNEQKNIVAMVVFCATPEFFIGVDKWKLDRSMLI
jgi:hypothetical protein